MLKGRKIELFTSRLQSILSLLQDNTLDYHTYVMMKTDLEEKIRLLSQATQVEQNRFRALTLRTANAMHLLRHLDELYEELSDQHKPGFFAWLFKKGLGWPDEDWCRLMRRPQQVMFGLYKRVDGDNEQELTKLAEVSFASLMELLQEELYGDTPAMLVQ